MYKVLLDSVEYTDIAIDNFVTKIGRDIKEKGFVKTYDQRLTFFKSAYTYIKELMNTSGPCGSVEIEVYKLCGGEYLLLTSGHIMLSDVIFEEASVCKVTIEIEDNTVNAVFLKSKGSPIFMDRGTLPDGTPVAPIRRPMRFFFNVNGGYLPETHTTDYAYAYPVFDAFDFILRQISNDNIRFASNFLSTPRQDATWTISFEGLTNGELATISFDTEFGDTINISVEIDTPLTGFGNSVSAIVDSQLGMYAIYEISGSDINFHITGNGRKGTLNSAYTDGAATVSYSVENEFVDGAGGLFITTGHRLSNKLDTMFELSFDDLFELINKLYDLTYTIEEVSGQNYLRVEPVEYFLNNSVSIDLEEVLVMEWQPESERVSGGLQIGKLYRDDDAPDYMFKHLNCGDIIDRRLPSDVHIMGSEIIAQITGTSDFGDDIFLIEGIDEGGGYDTPRFYEQGEYPNNIVSMYNVLLNSNEALLRYHLFFLPDAINRQLVTKDIVVEGLSTTTTVTNKAATYFGNPLWFIYKYTFTVPLSLQQFLQINASSLIKFRPHTSPGEDKYGYILDLEFPVKTGLTKFSLLVQ